MTRNIPIRYLKEDSTFDIELLHLLPDSRRWTLLNGYDTHIDDCYTFVLVISGKGTTNVDFRNITLTAGMLGVITPGQIHGATDAQHCTSWMLRISPEMMNDNYRHQIDEYSLSADMITLPNDTIEMLCDAMGLLSALLVLINKGMTTKTVVFNMLNVILGILTPELTKRNIKPLLRTAEITMCFKRLLPQYIRLHKRPSFYANQLCISEVYLNEAVKKSTGMTPTEWISANIILEAKRLLRSTTLSVKEVAYELGFNDYAYFSRIFKKCTHLTPLEFRRTILK